MCFQEVTPSLRNILRRIDVQVCCYLQLQLKMDVNVFKIFIFCPLLPTPGSFSVGLLSHLFIFLLLSYSLSLLLIQRLMAELHCFGYIMHVHNYTNLHTHLLGHGSLNMRVIVLKNIKRDMQRQSLAHKHTQRTKILCLCICLLDCIL